METWPVDVLGVVKSLQNWKASGSGTDMTIQQTHAVAVQIKLAPPGGLLYKKLLIT